MPTRLAIAAFALLAPFMSASIANACVLANCECRSPAQAERIFVASQMDALAFNVGFSAIIVAAFTITLVVSARYRATRFCLSVASISLVFCAIAIGAIAGRSSQNEAHLSMIFPQVGCPPWARVEMTETLVNANAIAIGFCVATAIMLIAQIAILSWHWGLRLAAVKGMVENRVVLHPNRIYPATTDRS